jgi:hypothetical protein
MSDGACGALGLRFCDHQINPVHRGGSTGFGGKISAKIAVNAAGQV